MPRIAFLPVLALLALVSLASAGVLLVARFGPPQLAAHIAFALGVMPLILSAIGYFVPVLTRGSPQEGPASIAAQLAAVAGALAVFAFAGGGNPAHFASAAGVAGMACLISLSWLLLRTRRMLGPRHRGLDWYAAALGVLLLALLAVVLMPAIPEWRNELRRFHLHANLLGFVGLTAVGTLQVLLPTSMGRADPGAALRLRRDVAWATTGTVLVAAGSAWASRGPAGAIMAIVGALIYLRVLGSMLLDWWRTFGPTLAGVHGAGASLVAAACGFALLLAAGIAHAAGAGSARAAIAGFVIAFLLPLVSGAVAQLLPVWLRPGVQGDWHHRLRAQLGRWAGARGWMLVLLGIGLTLAN